MKRIAPLRRSTPICPRSASPILAEVDRWTGFSQCFTHLQSGRAADEPRAILTAVLADATNLGHKRMAEACDLVTQRQLSWLASWHLREETYGGALARLVNAQHTAPLAALFGSGTSSSSDGQNFLLDRRAQATGAVNPHKGEPAVLLQPCLGSLRAVSFTVISASASEAAQVLDGLLHHGADLHIEEHHVDGGGVSDHVFAMPSTWIPGSRRASLTSPRAGFTCSRNRTRPRYRAAGRGPDRRGPDRRTLGRRAALGHLDPHRRRECIDHAGTARLLSTGQWPGLALREIGRVERTLFTLDWIEQPEQRRRATRELNKGEAENALKRAIFFHRIGRIRDHALQAQTHRASALNLVAGAIVLWNTTYLQAARMHLASLGRSIPPDLLQHLSPLGWQHINLTGDYLWTDPDAPSSALRPLRQMHAVEGPAKP
jgi:TnpA family transposase